MTASPRHIPLLRICAMLRARLRSDVGKVDADTVQADTGFTGAISHSKIMAFMIKFEI